jgi:hypothetical protein
MTLSLIPAIAACAHAKGVRVMLLSYPTNGSFGRVQSGQSPSAVGPPPAQIAANDYARLITRNIYDN